MIHAPAFRPGPPRTEVAAAPPPAPPRSRTAEEALFLLAELALDAARRMEAAR